MWEEEATEEAEEEKAAGAELKTKTPHSDVGKNSIDCNRLVFFAALSLQASMNSMSKISITFPLLTVEKTLSNQQLLIHKLTEKIINLTLPPFISWP